MDDILKERNTLKLPTFAELAEKELELVRARANSLMSFGVAFLDRALEGIARTDLILVGAPTGAGKTELVTHIAASNAYARKRVLFFPLEAEYCEIQGRIRFKLAAQRYNADRRAGKVKGDNLTYRKYYYSRLPDELKCYVTDVHDFMKEKFSTLHTRYRDHEFTVENLQRDLLALKDQTDLVIVDHLNYFDSDEPNENRAVSEIVKRIRDLALLSGLPIILVAHVRKQDRKNKILVPEIEDFHGTSNIFKIATKAILLSPDREPPDDPWRVNTYFRVAKFRVDNSVANYVARCVFNREFNKYESKFVLGKLSEDGRMFVPIEDKAKMPEWALEEG